MYFVLFGSHGGTAGGEAFIAAHQDDILPTASAFGVNRIGMGRFRDPLGIGSPVFTGEPENRAAFVTNPTLGHDIAAAFRHHHIPNAIYLPGSVMMIGEGLDFMAACVPTVLIRELNIGLGTSAADIHSTVLPDLETPKRLKRDVEAYLDVIDAMRWAGPGELRATDASPGCNPGDPSGFIDPVGLGEGEEGHGPQIPGGVVVLHDPGRVSVPAQRKIFPVFAYLNDFAIDDEAIVIRMDWDFGDGTPVAHAPVGAALVASRAPGGPSSGARLAPFVAVRLPRSLFHERPVLEA